MSSIHFATATRDFEVLSDLPGDALPSIGALSPANPFYTEAYVRYRRAQGDKPLVIIIRDSGCVTAGCTAFLRSGRVSRSLEITSLPRLTGEERFWSGLQMFCQQAGVTHLTICTFASPSGRIPNIAGEAWRKPRVEYVLDLCRSDLWRQMRKGHAWNVKQARKAGLTVEVARDHEACSRHAGLIEASMSRRMNRGEAVSVSSNMKDYLALMESGVGKLFQAFRGEQVVASNLILLAEQGAYNHTQGSTPEGMDTGAAHFLIFEIAELLRSEGLSWFNLGGTDQLGSGLERFKQGFGDATTRIELESASFCLERELLRWLKSSIRSFPFLRRSAPSYGTFL